MRCLLNMLEARKVSLIF